MITPTFCHFTDANRTINLAAIASIDHNHLLPTGARGVRLHLLDGNHVTLSGAGDAATLEDATRQYAIRVRATAQEVKIA
jgi:hypothetical protein